MEQGNRVPEKRQLTEELIQRVDSVSDSPAVRASHIWNIVNQHTEVSDWDLVCFCIEALGTLSTRYLWLREGAKVIAKLVYSAHYLYPNNFNARVAESALGVAESNGSAEREADGARPNAPKSLFERSD